MSRPAARRAGADRPASWVQSGIGGPVVGWIAPIGLFVLAMGIRLLPARYVWLPDRVLFFGYDAYYHMRRIFYTLVRFPESLDFDLYINYPDGARPIWTPLFDWLAAASMWPFRDALDVRGIEVWASLIPPVLGSLTVVVLYLVLRPRFGRGVGLLAAAVLALLPAHAWYSQVGFVDHHCAVALVTTCLLGAGLRFLERGPGSPAWLGVAMATCILVWPGTLLQVGVVGLVVGTTVLAAVDADRARIDARRLALSLAIACIGVAPLCLSGRWPQWSDASPVVLSRFQPWLFASGAVVAGIWSLMASRAWAGSRGSRVGSRPYTRIAAAMFVALAAVAASALAWPALGQGMAESWAWLSKTDDFQGLVGESRPLLVDADGRFSWVPGLNNLSAFLPVAPLAIALGAWRARRSERPAVVGLVLVWATVLIASSLLQRRFANSAAVAVAILLSLSVFGLYDIMRRRFENAVWRRLTALGLGAVVLALLAPGLSGYTPELAALFTTERGVALKGQRYEWYALYDTAKWLRAQTPSSPGWIDPSGSPSYGVVGPWDAGHVIQYVGRRATATNNFGDDIGRKNFLLVQAYFGGDESHGVEILERLDGRYVVVPHYEEFLTETPGPRSLYRALYDHDGRGSALASEDGANEETLDALAHHRLVYEFSRMRRGSVDPPPYKVFEHVPGAQVVGTAPPGARVRAAIAVYPPGGRRFEYVRHATASEGGHYAFVLPYASANENATVRTASHYTLTCGGHSASLRVGEPAVRRGARLRGPALCADANAGESNGADSPPSISDAERAQS